MPGRLRAGRASAVSEKGRRHNSARVGTASDGLAGARSGRRRTGATGSSAPGSGPRPPRRFC